MEGYRSNVFFGAMCSLLGAALQSFNLWRLSRR
jgi:hypothetical protein